MRLPPLLLLLVVGCTKPADRVVVYCAQDQEFAEGSFATFTAETGLAVAPKFDTEANKSVSLVEELKRESGRPRADVHWNNEPVGTVRLARAGLLEPYESPAALPFPPWTRPAGRTWQAFAARARVLVVNTQLVPEADRPRSVFDLAEPKWRGKAAMAKPLFGTTATHVACLFEAVGDERASDFFRRLKANDVQVVPGNKQVATGVAEGKYAVGVTDTDDAVIEVLAGRPVAVAFPDADGIGTLFLPNTVAVLKGSPNPAGARRLIDFLLRPETEARLAEGGGYQLPLNPAVAPSLPAALRPGLTVKRMAVDFETVADRWDSVQAVMRDLFAR
jgi:iron(III) transport system substrate-binding protein